MKTNYLQWINRGSKIARAALDVYIGVRKNEPIYIAGGVSSCVDLLTSWQEEKCFDICQDMQERELFQIENHYSVCNFLYETIRNMQLPYTQLRLNEKKQTSVAQWSLRAYDLDGENVFFLFRDTLIEGIYISQDRSHDDVIAAFGRVVRKTLGQYVSLSAAIHDWSVNMCLTQLKTHLDAYVSHFNVDEFVDTLRKFKERNINRSSLLHGPPGVGKTTFAELLTKRMNARLLVIESAPLKKAMEFGSPLESFINIVAPDIVLFDDLDRLDNLEDLFGEIERLNRTDHMRNLIFLGSVNNLEAIPEPLRRTGRFDEIIEFPLPPADLRKKILVKHLEYQGIRIMNEYVDNLVTWSEGLSGSDLREIALQISVHGFSSPKIKCCCDRISASKNKTTS